MSELDDTENGQQVAAELRRVREAAGLTMEQMATRLGMGYAPGGRRVSTGRAAVSAWEAGRRRPPVEYLKAYMEQRGDPAILAERPNSPGASSAETVRETAEPDLDVEQQLRRRRRWPAIAVTAIVLGGGIAGYFGLRDSGSARTHAALGPATSTALAKPTGLASTWTETTGTPAHSWADPLQLTGAGTPLGPRQSIQVVCRIRGYVVQDGDPWWYLIASTPWSRHYYATSDAFYNNGATSGPVDTGVVVDEQVPVCPGTPAVATIG